MISTLSPAVHSLVRIINQLNPTTHGRQFLMAIATRIAGCPDNGVHEIKNGIVMDLNMSELLERSIYYHAFERLCRSIILAHLRPDGVFVDVGANIGFYSILAKKGIGPKGRVIAFEPNPDVIAMLRRNANLNSLEIELFEVALSNREDTVMLYSRQGCHGETSMQNPGWTDVSQRPVRTARLDDTFPANVDRIDFLKIDVEGAEPLVFEGAQKVLERFRPPILLEINDKAARAFGFGPYDATKMLLRINPDYRIYEVTSHRIKPVTMESLEAKATPNANLLLTCNPFPPGGESKRGEQSPQLGKSIPAPVARQRKAASTLP